MNQQEQNDVIKALAIAAELTNTNWSEPAIKTVLYKLKDYDSKKVVGAIESAIETIKGRLTLAAIMERLPDPLGYRTPEVSWGTVSRLLSSEDNTGFLCDQEFSAMGACIDLYLDGDKIAARMAYLESYKTMLADVKVAKIPAAFRISPGRDPHQREAAIKEALANGLIGQDKAALLLPHYSKKELKGEVIAINSEGIKALEDARNLIKVAGHIERKKL